MPKPTPRTTLRFIGHCLLVIALLPIVLVSKPSGALAGSGDMAAAQARLALGLLDRSDGKGELANAVVSPLSAAAALGVAAIGASPDVSSAIAATLGLKGNPKGPAGLVDEARQSFDPAASGPARLALHIVFDETMALRAQGRDLLAGHGIKPATDRLTTMASVDAINRWVSEATSGVIPTILSQPPGEGFVALAALHFKGRWKTVFGKPEASDFRSAAGTTVKVPMMSLSSRTGRFRVSDAYAAAELPYQDDAYRMVVVTGRSDKGLTAADLPALAGWMAGEGFGEAEGLVKIPTFTLEDGGDITDPLDKLGLDVARKVKMGFPAFSDQPVAIAHVIQKTTVSVDEVGTEAAAATAVVGVRSAGNSSYIHVDARAPFVFCLRHVRTGLILAAGIVADPGKAPLQPRQVQ